MLGDPAMKAQTDNPLIARLWYTSINPQVKPLDNVDCRKAVEYAADRTGYQTAYGGEFAGGQIATTLLPPQIPGYQKFDLYPAGADNKGDVAKAKAALAACGQPDGFETNISYRAERPKEKATAESLQQSLARVGIKLTIKPYPQGDYFSQYAGNPPFDRANNIGLVDQRLGRGLERRLRLPVADRRQPGHPGDRWLVQHQRPVPGDRHDDRPGRGRDRRGQAQRAVGQHRQGGHGAGGHPARRLRQVADLVRPAKLTNVFVNQAYGMYDYLSLGVA